MAAASFEEGGGRCGCVEVAGVVGLEEAEAVDGAEVGAEVGLG